MIIQLFLAILMLAAPVWAQNQYVKPTTELMVRQWDDGDRDAAAVNTMLSGLNGSRQVTAVFDGGPWNIDADVSFPSNVNVSVEPGCQLNVSSGKVITFNGGELIAGDWAIFGGSGTATGTATFLHRNVNWGDTSKYSVGTGLVVGTNDATYVRIDGGYTYADGTTQSVDGLVVRGNSTFYNRLVLTNGLTANDITGDSIDMTNAAFDSIELGGTTVTNWDQVLVSNGFAGYTNIALDTTMIIYATVTGDGTNTAVTTSSFTNAFDGVTNTFTDVGVLNQSTAAYGQNDYFTYMFDLGQSYSGFIEVQMQSDGDEVDRASAWNVSATDTRVDPTVDSAAFPKDGVWNGPGYNDDSDTTDDPIFTVPGMSFNWTDGVYRHSSIVQPFYGRYFLIYGGAFGAPTADDIEYKFSVIKVYGVAK